MKDKQSRLCDDCVMAWMEDVRPEDGEGRSGKRGREEKKEESGKEWAERFRERRDRHRKK